MNPKPFTKNGYKFLLFGKVVLIGLNGLGVKINSMQTSMVFRTSTRAGGWGSGYEPDKTSYSMRGFRGQYARAHARHGVRKAYG